MTSISPVARTSATRPTAEPARCSSTASPRMPAVGWRPRKDNKYIGKDIPRMDGVEKATGAAKYSADRNPKGTLYAKVLTFKGGHGKVKSLDLEDAKKVPGVKAVFSFVKEGDEVQ